MFKGNVVYVKKKDWNNHERYGIPFQFSKAKNSYVCCATRTQLTEKANMKIILSKKQQQTEKKIFSDVRKHPQERLRRALILRTNDLGCKRHELGQHLKVKIEFAKKNASLICVRCTFETLCKIKLPKKFCSKKGWNVMIDEFDYDLYEEDDTAYPNHKCS